MTLRDICKRFGISPRQAVVSARQVERELAARPMPMAEFDDCCGQYRWGTALEDQGGDHANHCENCPILIERRERVLRAGRAM